MKIALIIAAAGSSTRYSAAGGLRSKIDEDLGGRPVLQRAIEAFVKHEHVGPMIASIIVAGPNDPADPEVFAEFKARHGDRLGLLGATIIKGGVKHRYETVQNALRDVGDDATHVAVHDAARPCASPELLDRIFEAAEKHPAVIPAIEVGDTLKRVREEDADEDGEDRVAAILGVSKGGTRRVVEATVPRDRLVAVQTPQVFEVGLLRRAYAQKDLSSTDDAGLVERVGEKVVVVEGEVTNIKITRPADLALARAILGVKPPEGRAAHKRF